MLRQHFCGNLFEIISAAVYNLQTAFCHFQNREAASAKEIISTFFQSVILADIEPGYLTLEFLTGYRGLLILDFIDISFGFYRPCTAVAFVGSDQIGLASSREGTDSIRHADTHDIIISCRFVLSILGIQINSSLAVVFEADAVYTGKCLLIQVQNCDCICFLKRNVSGASFCRDVFRFKIHGRAGFLLNHYAGLCQAFTLSVKISKSNGFTNTVLYIYNGYGSFRIHSTFCRITLSWFPFVGSQYQASVIGERNHIRLNAGFCHGLKGQASVLAAAEEYSTAVLRIICILQGCSHQTAIRRYCHRGHISIGKFCIFSFYQSLYIDFLSFQRLQSGSLFTGGQRIHRNLIQCSLNTVYGISCLSRSVIYYDFCRSAIQVGGTGVISCNQLCIQLCCAVIESFVNFICCFCSDILHLMGVRLECDCLFSIGHGNFTVDQHSGAFCQRQGACLYPGNCNGTSCIVSNPEDSGFCIDYGTFCTYSSSFFQRCNLI